MTGAVIGRFVLDLSADTAETAAEAETAIVPGLQDDALCVLLEECLAELPAVAAPIWIDTLSVDLGRVPLAITGDDLRQHAKAAIKHQLATAIADARAEEAGTASSSRLSPLTILARFLSHGVIHWSHTAPLDVAVLTDEAAAHDLPGVRALLRSAMADPLQAQRLAAHLSPAQIARLSSIIAPQAGGLLTRLHRVFVELHRDLPVANRPAPEVMAAANQALLEAGTRLGSVWISEARVADEFAASIARNLRLDAGALKSGMIARLRDPRRMPDGGKQDNAAVEIEALLARADDGGVRSDPAGPGQNQREPAAQNMYSADRTADPAPQTPGRGEHDLDAVSYFLRTGLPPSLGMQGPERLAGQLALRRALLAWLPLEGQGGLTWQALRQRLDAEAAGTPSILRTRLRMLLTPEDARRALRRLGYAEAEAGLLQSTGALGEGQDGTGQPDETPRYEGDANRDLALFWYLMEFGALPWWGRDIVQGSVDRWTRAFVEDEAAQVAASLQAATESRRALLVERMAARLALEPLAAIVSVLRPALRQEAAHWLGQALAIHQSVTINAGEWVTDGRTAPAAEQVLTAMAAALLARLFDPHAPVRDWPELLRELTSTVARRLRLPEAAFLPGGGGSAPDAGSAPAASAEPLTRALDVADEASTQPENDTDLLAHFLSPTGQLTVPLAAIRGLLDDGERRQGALSRLSVADVDEIAARLAPGEPLLRMSVLLPLGDALRPLDPAWDSERWRHQLLDGIAQVLALVMAGQSGRAASVSGLLDGLMRFYAARAQQALPTYIEAVANAASNAEAVLLELAVLLSALALEASETSTSDAPLPPVSAASEHRPPDHPDQRLHGPRQRRFGQPEMDRFSVAEAVSRFLALPDSAPEEADLASGIRLLLAEPVGRASVAVQVTARQLDRLGQRLGLTDGAMLPSDVGALDSLLAAIVPGGTAPGWVVQTIAALLAGWNDAGTVQAEGITSQMRRILLAFARNEGMRYEAIVQGLASQARSGRRTRGSRLNSAIEQLAKTAAADAPVPDAETVRPPPIKLPDSALPERMLDPGPPVLPAEPPDTGFGPSRTEDGLVAGQRQTAGPPRPAADSLDHADRLLMEAAVAGGAEAAAALRMLLMGPAYRVRLGAVIGLPDLERLIAAVPGMPGGVQIGGLSGLGPLVGAVAAEASAPAWRRAVAATVLRLVAEGTALPDASAVHRLVLGQAAAALNLGGDTPAAWAGLVLEAEGAGGVRIHPAIRQALEEMRDGPGAIADGQAAAGLAAGLTAAGVDFGEAAGVPRASPDGAAGLLERLLAGDSSAASAFRAAILPPSQRAVAAAILSPAVLDRLSAALLSWEGAVLPSHIAGLGLLIAREGGQISAADWREIVAGQVLAQIAEEESGTPGEVRLMQVLERSLRAASGNAEAVPYLAGAIASMPAGLAGEAAVPDMLAAALSRIASGAVAAPDSVAADWQHLPVTALAELLLAVGRTSGAGQAMAEALERQLREAGAAQMLQQTFLRSTRQRLADAFADFGFAAAPLIRLAPLETAAVSHMPGQEEEITEASLKEQQPQRQGPSLHALPNLAQTLIAMPRSAPHFREVAEAVWAGLFADREETRVQELVPPQTLRTTARILRQAGYRVSDAEGRWAGQIPAATHPSVEIHEEPSLEALAASLLETRPTEPLLRQTRSEAEKLWHGLRSRAGRAVIAAAFPAAARAELAGILAGEGYSLSQQQRAGLGLPGMSMPGRASTSGSSGPAPPDTAPAPVQDAVPTAQQRRRDADGWPWQDDDGTGSDWARELLFVDDAGVVLLWPFLVHYFDRIGLLEDGKFASEDAAARGVMLIHYMATTETETEEPRLVLPKLLCGVPFETPVIPRIDLTELEETVSDELLNVVCQNWSPLRNSSVEALRETFLLRDGSLSWLEERIWVLNVTAKPYDMLLGQLPWTLSTFKTPLMQYPMMVQWGQQ